jgi:hypothetical protein
MAKKKIIKNELIDPLRENYDWIEESIVFTAPVYNFDKSEYTQRVRFRFPPNKFGLVNSMLGSFGEFEYHDCDLSLPTKPDNQIIEKGIHQFYEAKSVYNYTSDSYERMIKEESEAQLPNFYLEFINESNEKYVSSKVLEARKINKNFFDNISRLQTNLTPRSAEDINRLKKIIIGDYHDSRDFANLKDFPYYNKIIFNEIDDEVIVEYLDKINFLEPLVSSSLTRATSPMNFRINTSGVIETLQLPTTDLMDFLNEINSSFDESSVVVLKDTDLNKSPMINFQKKQLFRKFIEKESSGLVKSYKSILNREKCKIENVFFKVEKFLGTTGDIPIQTYFLPANKNIYQIIDTQIKKDTNYSYKVKAVFIIYGTKYKLHSYAIGETANLAEFTIVSSPSYKMVEMELLEQTVMVNPTSQLSPSAMFFNKSNSKNEIGIYLDLRMGTEYLKPIKVNNTDPSDSGDNKKYEYSVQQGVFEVFRIDKKPTSYEDFANQKLMDIQNSINSTSVSFKDYVLPNTKYYYIFRSLNTSLDPSNPTVIYQVELLKDSDDSKISVETYDFNKEKNYLNRTFKRLIQIKPAFQQSVFDDTKNNVADLDTFKNKLSELSLGFADHGLWGRKFKIRVKSTDSGKIIDFNIKFKLSKKETDEDLE